ncbi:hypothetical protein [Erwinia oleae]|uniref:hypothetical protein n=1 Tax=Erwinia oleae TaxID=796334 RepID=UPI001269EA81|nr:hypothetical protein [Erwinia oleae]
MSILFIRSRRGRIRLARRRRLASSGAAGTKDTRAMLAFCQQHNIVADVEVVAIRDINSVLARLEKGDVRYRFVIDMQRG